jgi:enoyl-CoA hydratase/carnithine racemase
MSQFVQFDHAGPVATLTLDKPPINALDEAALDELLAAADQVEKDESVRAVIIASGIERIFCAGGDLKYWPQRYAGMPDQVSRAGRRVFARLEALAKPTIAAIAGAVIGDGISLALSCDIRIASQVSQFRLPETAYGFIPGWGTIARLHRAVGQAVTSELLFTDTTLSARRAQMYGLVNRVTVTEDVMPTARMLANQIAARSPRALHQAKAALVHRNVGREEDESWEANCFAAAWEGAECTQGIERLFQDKGNRRKSPG